MKYPIYGSKWMVRFKYGFAGAAVCLIILGIHINMVNPPYPTSCFFTDTGNNHAMASSGTSFQSYITPDSVSVREFASGLNSVEEAYDAATRWVYVSEQELYGVPDKWSRPEDFLTESPDLPGNPVPGSIAGDCEEQANTLASIIRALGIPSEEVRVCLGLVSPNNSEKGHVWVEVFIENHWYILDPSQGPYWDEDSGRLIQREGIPFGYYLTNLYPVRRVTAYYNDVYYYEPGERTADVPGFWTDSVPGEMMTTISRGS